LAFVFRAEKYLESLFCADAKMTTYLLDTYQIMPPEHDLRREKLEFSGRYNHLLLRLSALDRFEKLMQCSSFDQNRLFFAQLDMSSDQVERRGHWTMFMISVHLLFACATPETIPSNC
jgi:hypothetical protein